MSITLTPQQLLTTLNLLGWESARDKYRDIWIMHPGRKLLTYARYAGGVIPMFELPGLLLAHEIIDPMQLVGREAERWTTLAWYVLKWEGGRR